MREVEQAEAEPEGSGGICAVGAPYMFKPTGSEDHAPGGEEQTGTEEEEERMVEGMRCEDTGVLATAVLIASDSTASQTPVPSQRSPFLPPLPADLAPFPFPAALRC